MDQKAALLLRVSCRADGAMGRSRRGCIYRWAADRRHAGSQRAPACPLYRHIRRSRHPRFRSGRLPVPEEKIVKKWRLQPGKMLLIDLEKGRIVSDDGNQGRIWPTRILIGSGSIEAKCGSKASPTPRPCSQKRTSPCSIVSRLSATRRKAGNSCLRRWSRRDRRPSARWEPTRLFRRCLRSQSCSHIFQAEFRPGDEPADRSDPRRTRDEPRVVHRAATEYSRSRRHLETEAARSIATHLDK